MTDIDVIRTIAQADIDGADAHYLPQSLLDLCDQVEELERQLRGARLALSVVKDALAAERANR